MQRALERKVRKYKKQYPIEDSVGVDTANTAVKLKNSRFNLKEFVYATNGRVDNFRISTAGFGKRQAGKANWIYKIQTKLDNINTELIQLRQDGIIKLKGTAIKPPKIPDNIVFSEHSLQRLNERNLSKEKSLSFAENAIVAFEQRRGAQYTYYSPEGFVTIGINGTVISTGELDDGGKKVIEVIKKNGL